MRASWYAPAVVLLFACKTEPAPESSARRDPGAVARPADVRGTPAHPDRFGDIGRPATVAEVRAWDIDVNASGEGLPAGRGTADAGARIYAQQCASCHGVKGEGIAPNPRLVAVEPRDFSFAKDARLPKAIGNYWPHATTLYDYINRAMPFNAPGTLSADEVYGVVAFLLAENQIIPRTAVMDRASLPKVRMPARERFVRDDREGATAVR